MKFPVSRVIVLNQSPFSAVPLLVRSPKNPKTALMGDLLYIDFKVTLRHTMLQLVYITVASGGYHTPQILILDFINFREN